MALAVTLMIATVAGAITNLILEPMHIGSVKSEVRILGTDSKQDVVLLAPWNPLKTASRCFEASGSNNYLKSERITVIIDKG